MDVTKWLDIAALAVGGIGVLVIVWALFWDRARGRQRCPKCWYDMSATAGVDRPRALVCPECGHDAKTPRRLRKTRRRWGVAAATLAVLVLTAGVPSWERRREGWTALIPTTGLIIAWRWNREHGDFVPTTIAERTSDLSAFHVWMIGAWLEPLDADLADELLIRPTRWYYGEHIPIMLDPHRSPSVDWYLVKVVVEDSDGAALADAVYPPAHWFILNSLSDWHPQSSVWDHRDRSGVVPPCYAESCEYTVRLDLKADWYDLYDLHIHFSYPTPITCVASHEVTFRVETVRRDGGMSTSNPASVLGGPASQTSGTLLEEALGEPTHAPGHSPTSTGIGPPSPLIRAVTSASIGAWAAEHISVKFSSLGWLICPWCLYDHCGGFFTLYGLSRETGIAFPVDIELVKEGRVIAVRAAWSSSFDPWDLSEEELPNRREIFGQGLIRDDTLLQDLVDHQSRVIDPEGVEVRITSRPDRAGYELGFDRYWHGQVTVPLAKVLINWEPDYTVVGDHDGDGRVDEYQNRP